MKSGYKRLGNYIRLVDERNRDLEVKTLLGVSIRKILIPSIANIVGTDMSTYKIIKNNQFAYGTVTSRNGDKISIALLKEHDKAIVSQVYLVFEVIDEELLLPDYLMMWFRRPEFDRYARFKSHGSARETFGWAEMLETELPIPSLEKQKELVAEYEVIENRIQLNKKLCATLEETAQTIYKQWFEDFEFPDENGNPYKSSGGKMVECEELGKEIPIGWRVDQLGNVVDTIGGGTPATDTIEYWENGNIIWYSPTDVTKNNGLFSSKSNKNITESGLKNSSAKLIKPNSVLMTSRATIAEVIINEQECSTNQGFISIIVEDNFSEFFVLLWIKSHKGEIFSLASGTTFLEISKSAFREMKFIIPCQNCLKKFDEAVVPIFKKLKITEKQIQKLEEMKVLLLGKMAVKA